MPRDISAVIEQVRGYLVELFGSAEVDGDGDFMFRHGSTQVWVGVKPFHTDHTVVRIYALTNANVPPTPELFRFVATRGTYVFGHLRCTEAAGRVTVYFSHSLLGETLDPESFKVAVYMVAGIADELDDEIRRRFGGETFHAN
jgi:hypothetical protein